MWHGMHWGGRRDCGPRGGRGGWDRFGAHFAAHWADATEGRGGGRGRRMFDGGELRLVLLKLIADQPRHGYDLIRAIEALTHGAYAPSPGVVYPTLTLLDEMGLIAEERSDGAKKRFAATGEGRAHLAERADEVERLFRRLEALGEDRREQGGSPIWRAVRNLGVALRNKQAHGGFSQDDVHEVAAMIDELAQKIERLR